MQQIANITSDTKQRRLLILENGSNMELYLEYRTFQLGWFAAITYGDFKVQNLRVTTSPNFLHQYRNLIPFGLACKTDENQDPLLPEDFEQGRSSLFLLNATETKLVEDFINGET